MDRIMRGPGGPGGFGGMRRTMRRSGTSTSIEIVKLTRDNAVFSAQNGFVYLSLNGEKAVRVSLNRAFPFDMPWQYISATNDDGDEMGMIDDIADFDDDTAAILRAELERVYYSLNIIKIYSIVSKPGYTKWSVLTDAGKLMFTTKDTFKNILHIGEIKAIITDIDGNRYVIEDKNKLDKTSRHKIDLYI